MKCDSCRKENANVHMTSIVNGVKEEHHYCQQCANQKEQGTGSMFSSMFDDTFFNNQFFANVMYPQSTLGNSKLSACPQCGMTISAFNHQGRLGCDKCYEAFQQHLVPLIKRIQGSTSYEGRLPQRGAEALKIEQTIKQLRNDLIQAVKQEQFERAAQIRDEIKSLEQPKESI